MNPFSNNEKAWNLYLKVLEEMVGDSNSPEEETFQPLAVLKQADWDNVDKPNFNLYREYMVSNLLPRWGGMGTDSGKKLTEVYGDFLARLIKIISQDAGSSTQLNDEDKKRIKEFDLLHTESKKDEKFYNEKAKIEWEEYLMDNESNPYRLSQYEFYNQNSNWIIAQGYKDQATSYAYQILKIMEKTQDPDLRILNVVRNNFEKNPLMKIRLPERADWEDEIYKMALFLKQDISGDIFRFKRETLEQTKTINSSTSESRTVSTSWSGSVGINYGPFSFGGGGSGSRLEQEARDKATSVTMTFNNIQEFSIERSDWFSMYIIERYGKRLPEFWGENGLFNVIPTSIVLVKGIRVNVVSSNSYSKRVEEHFQAKKSVGWGPFKFSAKYRRDSIYSKIEVNGDSFTITSLTDDAYILGFRCALPHSKDDNIYMAKCREEFEKFQLSKDE